MKNPHGVIARWTVLVGVFAVAATIGAVFMLSEIGTYTWTNDELSLPWTIGLILISVLLWIAVISSIRKQPTLAGIFAIIGGVLSLPLGILLIIAGVRLLAAARSMTRTSS